MLKPFRFTFYQFCSFRQAGQFEETELKDTSNQSGNGHKHHTKSPYAVKANEFRKRRGWKKYMMVPNETLDKEMMDAVWPPEMRVLFAIRRYSWGNLNDFAVDGIKLQESDPSPRPTTQKQLSELLDIPAPTVNKAVSFLKKAGYLDPNHMYLCPLDKVTSLESTDESGTDFRSGNIHLPFLRFKNFLISKGVEAVKIIPPLEEKRKQKHEEAKQLSLQIREAEQYAWKMWRAYQRGNNLFEYKEDSSEGEKVA